MVKKLTVKERTKPLEVARFLSSVHESLDKKMWEKLRQSMDLDALDELAADITGAEKKDEEYKIKGRITFDKIQESLKKLKSPKTGKKVNKIVSTKPGKQPAKAYLTRKVLELLKMRIEPDPDKIEKHIKKKRLQQA